MVKFTSSDVLAILRRYEKADDSDVPRFVEQLKTLHPSPLNQLLSFRFKRRTYHILVDDRADDDLAYITQQMTTDRPLTGELLRNPQADISTYGLPFKGKDVYLFAVASSKQRLDLYLTQQYVELGLSRSTWQKHIKAGHITVNDTADLSPNDEVGESDSVAISLPSATTYDDHTLPIMYIDDNVVVVNKPVGVLTHAKGALSEEFTVADFMRRYTTAGTDTNRPGIVHRLDRDTSGVIIGVRNDETAQLLARQFADRTVKKTYYAVVVGVPKQPEAIIDLPIGRNPSKPSQFRVDPKGKPAQTAYEVVATDGTYSLVRLRPKTGRTHQLRVHLSYIGTPILGDRVYGKPADRLYLHASSLEITIPVSQRKTFAAPLPDEFLTLFPDVAL